MLYQSQWVCTKTSNVSLKNIATYISSAFIVIRKRHTDRHPWNAMGKGSNGAGRGNGNRGRGRGWYYAQKYGRKSSRSQMSENGTFEDRFRRDGNDEESLPSLVEENFSLGGFERSTTAALSFPSNFSSASSIPSYATFPREKGTINDLERLLIRIDKRQYPAYKDTQGVWVYPTGAKLSIDWIQGDPYASPSRCRVLVPENLAGFPRKLYENRVRKIALEDYLTRSFGAAVSASGGDVRAQNQGWKGEKGGDMMVDKPGQYVIERSSVQIHKDGSVEARFTVGLPARGRTILGSWASSILCNNLPRYISEGLLCRNLNSTRIQMHVDCVEDSEALRGMLDDLGLVAFVADGSILPRASGNSDLPMTASQAVTFRSPDELAITVELPHKGSIRGMGIRKGITLICGGGFHGKTTLLEALQVGVYNKVLGDGREYVVVHPSAVKIRAEDGRYVNSVDISPYINNLPLRKDTRCFDSTDASGSTSQATNIQEALEVGSKVLLIDEDTSATNFMVRDMRMSELVAPEKEPISPFIDRIEALASSGVSSILVLGGTGEYFHLASTVLMLDSYKIHDATSQAHEIAKRYNEASSKFQLSKIRNNKILCYPVIRARILSHVLNGSRHEARIRTRGKSQISVDEETLDLNAVEQLVEESQTRTIAYALSTLHRYISNGKWKALPLEKIVEILEMEIDTSGLDYLTEGTPLGNLARPRRYEIVAAISRLRSAKFSQLQ